MRRSTSVFFLKNRFFKFDLYTSVYGNSVDCSVCNLDLFHMTGQRSNYLVWAQPASGTDLLKIPCRGWSGDRKLFPTLSTVKRPFGFCAVFSDLLPHECFASPQEMLCSIQMTLGYPLKTCKASNTLLRSVFFIWELTNGKELETYVLGMPLFASLT